MAEEGAILSPRSAQTARLRCQTAHPSEQIRLRILEPPEVVGTDRRPHAHKYPSRDRVGSTDLHLRWCGAKLCRVADATGLEILDRLLLGQTAFHRCDDAWDLLDDAGLVSAVLCPRIRHVSIAPVARRVPPAPVGRLMPYGEKVVHKVTADNIEEGLSAVRDLVRRSLDEI